MRFQFKEPDMSEFKVGDWVKMKDDSSAWMGRVEAIEYKPCFDSKWNRYEIEILVFEDGTKLGSGWAIHVVKAAGHRIDTKQIEDIGDERDPLIQLKEGISKLRDKFINDAIELSLLDEMDKSRVYDGIANQLDQLLKGGA